MIPARPTEPIITTQRARCRDCYRCLRVCPVKAIRMENGQAHVVTERCLACGTCIRECPQQAKTFRNDLQRVKAILADGPTAASLAPSYAGWLSDWERRRLPSALRRLGFHLVTETAVGALLAAKHSATHFNASNGRNDLCTACPAAVQYIRRYQKPAISRLLPTASPMQTHARLLKSAHPGLHVIFIGPCIAKKLEADNGPEDGVDAAITFIELQEWLEAEDVKLTQCEESRLDLAPCGEARFFPLPGGFARTAALQTDLADPQTIAVTGFDEIRAALAIDRRGGPPLLIEPLFCLQGCINGAAWPENDNIFDRRRRLMEYARGDDAASTTPSAVNTDELPTDLASAVPPAPSADTDKEYSEEEILRVLAQIGKIDPADQLNCGACGYPTCRDKAIAVLAGMAEVEMCIPYMRRLAERRTDRIIETSPNGILITDEDLTIISMNPTFRKFFNCSDGVLGKHLSYLMDTAPFEKVLADNTAPLVNTVVHHHNYQISCRQLIYRLQAEKQIVGIFISLARGKAQRELHELKQQTLRRAGELLEHQVSMAQQMARFLGESTAHGEELVRNLMEMASHATTRNDDET